MSQMRDGEPQFYPAKPGGVQTDARDRDLSTVVCRLVLKTDDSQQLTARRAERREPPDDGTMSNANERGLSSYRFLSMTLRIRRRSIVVVTIMTSRREYLSLEAIDPRDGKRTTVLLSHERLMAVGRRSKGHAMECAEIVPMVLESSTE